MARKAKLPVSIAKGVEVKIDGDLVKVKGPKGELSQKLGFGVTAKVEGDQVHVNLDENIAATEGTKFLGLYHSLISNMVLGVSAGFTKQLEMIGVGYRAAVKGNQVEIQAGFSHPVARDIPKGIQVAVDKNTKIEITGADKQAVGQFAADIREIRKPEPYKGKGIRYVDEYVRRKAGKAGKK